jgi:hypothetical protein
MSSRERLTSGTGSGPALRPPAGPDAPSRPVPQAEAAPAAATSWEEIYRGVPEAQQTELLALARRQGLLYGHQLPPARNGGTARAEAGRQLLDHLLAGHIDGLEPVRPELLDFRDGALDPAQRDAVRRAAQTPDIFLLRGLPGTGKSRVVAEVITQAAAHGERVLLLAHSAAAVDRALELVADREEVYAIRCLEPGEDPSSLPPASQPLTLAERVRQWEEALARTRREADDRDRRARCLALDEPVWNSLGELAERLARVRDELAALNRRRGQLGDEVGRDAAAAEGATTAPEGTFTAAVAACAARGHETDRAIETALAENRLKAEARRQDLAAWQSRAADLRALAEARGGWHVWRADWWKSVARRGLATELVALEDEGREIEAALDAMAREAEQLTQKRQEAENVLYAERQRLIESEWARRQTELDTREAGRRRDQATLEAAWGEAVQRLDPSGPRAATATPEALSEARQAWQEQRQQLAREGEFAREWAACVEEVIAQRAQLYRHANVLAGTTTAVAATGPAAEGPFDLLVLQESDRITESEFAKWARRARRWVLVGEPPDPYQRTTAASPRAPRPAVGPSRPMPTGALSAGFFHRLWQRLHWSPRALPYAWVQEGDRLCCRLRAVPPPQRAALETERLADFPDIELRILAAPGNRPVLAEVVFPPSVSVAQAKVFIFKELEELAVEARGEGPVWAEEPGLVALHLSPGEPAAGLCAALEPGVAEWVGAAGPEANGVARAGRWETRRLEFDRAAGWDRRRAEDWVSRYLNVRDLARTAHLDVPHRMQPDLAAFLSHLLFGGAYGLAPGSPGSANGHAPCVEFVPVPSFRRERGERGRDRRDPARPRDAAGGAVPRAGAGLELDLADARHRARLPADLVRDLPPTGVVNYPEAQAVVRVLEGLAATPQAGAPPALAVIALSEGQAGLIRGLVRQSPRLAVRSRVDVGVPAAFREREYPVVLVSLTRSSAHRAVSFGEGPEALALALTRARCRLVIVGDPGTLARRSQWEGPLDHLDAAAAARERELVSHLLQYLQGRGTRPDAFCLHEGSRT